MKKGILTGILAITLFLNGCKAGTTKDSSTQGASSGQPETELSSESSIENFDKNEEFVGITSCNIGDAVFFGSYEQDNNTENGEETIEWIVLDAKGENVLLLSKYGLDAQAYNSSDEAVTWESSSLRQWLNDTFYNAAFSEAQKEVIIPVINVNLDNERWGTSGGNDTKDTVFLLSIEEAETYFSDRNETFWTQATPYAVEQGAFVADNGDSPWWLRSPGDHNDGGFCAAYVDYRPSGVSLSGYAAQNNSRTVRPSLWVKTQSDGSADNSLPEQSQNSVKKVEDCQLRLIDCHQFEDEGAQFTYLAFVLRGPADIGFHLESDISDVSDVWLASNHRKDGWRVVTCDELPGKITPENLSLNVTDYSTAEEKSVLLSDWGDPMSQEELQSVGIYEIEGHLALVGDGSLSENPDQYGFLVGLGLVGPEYGKPNTSFPTLENVERVFRFYAADGTPLAQSLGQEIDECYMTGGTLKVWFGLPEGADSNTAMNKLLEKDPYMEYTNADGATFQFPLQLNR